VSRMTKHNNLEFRRTQYYYKQTMEFDFSYSHVASRLDRMRKNISIIYTITCARGHTHKIYYVPVCVSVYTTTSTIIYIYIYIYIYVISVRVLPPVYNVGALPWLRSRSKGDQTACRYTYPR